MATLLWVGDLAAAGSPDGRFVAVAGGIQDNVSGLTWQQPHVAGTFTFTNAAAQCASGWRLPTIDELETLRDVRQPLPPLIDPNFSGMDTIFWSATPNADGANAWFINFDNGTISSLAKTTAVAVVCVK